MISTKAGRAVYFPVRNLSNLSLRFLSLLSRGFTTVSAQSPAMYRKRISASAAIASVPLSDSICLDDVPRHFLFVFRKPQRV